MNPTNSSEYQAKKEILTRILATRDDIQEIKKICRVPSISYGLLHNGEVIFRESIGVRDVETKQPANPDTLYSLASVSKGFLSALAGIAVAEGKLSWTAPISTYLPDFNPFDDPDVGKKARIIDCLRHSAGVSTCFSLVIGPRGHRISKEEDFIEFLNQCPSKDEEGKVRYNTWNYSNWGYGLVAMCLQKVYWNKYHELLQQKILDPIGLHRTVIRKIDLEKDDNIAQATFMREDGTVEHLSVTETDEDHTPHLSVMGIRSSINDMLKWAKAILAAEKVEKKTLPRQMPNYPPGNPLRYISTTRGKAYWTRPNHDAFGNVIAYCLGWLKVITPSSGLGSIGMNMRSRDNPVPEKWIIGAKSPKMEVLLHGGIGAGASCMFYTIPETQSAIMVFSNGIQNGCAADFTAQVLMQALFGLKPHVDLIAFVKAEVETKLPEGYPKLLREWQEHRDVSVEESPKKQYVGDYKACTTTLSVKREESCEGEQHLTVTFGTVEETKMKLELYGKDTYSCFPQTEDDWWRDTMHCWTWETGILRFQRDEEGKISGLIWKHTPGEYSTHLKKVFEIE